MMNPPTRIKQNSIATMLDLPTELIVNICIGDEIKLTDIFNLAICHSKLNNSLFHQQNSVLWKSKYIQKYGPLYKNEFEINIDEQNTWKNEISLRLRLDKLVSCEIEQMPGKYLRYHSVPYHLLPFTEYLHSKHQSRRFYVLSAVLTFYKRLLNNDCCNANYDLLYMAHLFLIYSSQVYFGYKIKDFLCTPITGQITEKGFYLLGRWWCPSDDTSYWDMNNKLNDIAVKVCKTIQDINPLHPIVGRESGLDQIYKRGQNILDHDLFNETSTICILDCLRKVMFANRDVVCYCTTDINCFLLQKALELQSGSVFILCVIFESVARRLGVKVNLTATSAHHFVSWSSSWPGSKDPTCYLIDINAGGVMRRASICPVSKKLPDCFELNSLPDLFWLFSGSMEQIYTTYKFIMDFQKILKPNDNEVKLRYQKFHDFYDYCICPLLRDSLNPHAPNHADMKDTLYLNWEEIFPSVPQTRGTNDDPKYSIGMMVDTISVGSGSFSSIRNNKRGIIVGWTRMLSTNPSSKKTVYLYHVLIIPDSCFMTGKNQTPVIKSLMENKHEKLKRQLLETFDYNFKNVGKFFKHYSNDLCAFIPINDLAKLYPDDHSFTVSKSRNLKIK